MNHHPASARKPNPTPNTLLNAWPRLTRLQRLSLALLTWRFLFQQTYPRLTAALKLQARILLLALLIASLLPFHPLALPTALGLSAALLLFLRLPVLLIFPWGNHEKTPQP